MSTATATKLLQSSALVAGSFCLLGSAALLHPTSVNAAGFSTTYDPSAWTFNNINANGFVNTSNAPALIQLTGGDNWSGWGGETTYTTTASKKSLVSFNWDYGTSDWNPSYDPFGFLLNNSFTKLTQDWGSNFQSGIVNILLQAGDTFGFSVQTTDNSYGAATANISNFKTETVPEPASTLGLLALGAMGAVSTRKRNKKDS